jgi:hypothetical protein
MKNQNRSYVTLSICLLFVLACNSLTIGLDPATEAPPSAIPAEPTKPARPTSTPRPEATPNVAATQSYDDIFSEVEKFKDDGLIPSTDGEYTVLDDFSETFAQRGYLQYSYFDFEVKHFVYKAHVAWSTAGVTNDTSGCGIVFAVNQKGDGNSYYGVVLDKNRIFFSTTYGGYYYDMGKTRGTGKVSFDNPAEADFTLVVYDYKANVYVDGDFIGEYTLSKDRELQGKFGYGIISGTNKDYGTRCDITESRMWVLSE